MVGFRQTSVPALHSFRKTASSPTFPKVGNTPVNVRLHEAAAETKETTMKKVIAVFVFCLALALPASAQPSWHSADLFSELWSQIVALFAAVDQTPEGDSSTSAPAAEPEMAPSTIPNGSAFASGDPTTEGGSAAPSAPAAEPELVASIVPNG